VTISRPDLGGEPTSCPKRSQDIIKAPESSGSF
jgi:hypothetical protein